MPIRTERWITRDMLKASPQVLWCFGDNFVEWGMGGQASQMRGEHNAVGLPTKKYPALSPPSFLKDLDLATVKTKSRLARLYLARHLQSGGTVVWPLAGIGTGYARLEQHAPAIHMWYKELYAKLVAVPHCDNMQEYQWIQQHFAIHYTQIHGKRWPQPQKRVSNHVT